MAQKTTRPKGKASAKKSGAGDQYQKALDSFDKAVKTLHKGDAAKAKELFVKLVDGFPGERELLDRVRSYIAVCESKLAPQKRLKDAEEMVTAGVIELNRGDAAQALKHFTKASDLDPKNPHVHYNLAAAHAAAGDAASAAKHLKTAIAGDPSAKVHARADEVFAGIRGSAELAPLLANA